MESKRLNKFISDAGFCSRREADQLIAHERVTVNGKLPEAGTKVSATDKVRIDGQILHVREEAPVFLVFNKPAGIATTTDRSVRNNIISALNHPAALQPIGFLDRESEGLLLLSNDTELAHKLTKADNLFEKEYVVTVDRMLTPDFLAKISENAPTGPGGPRKKSAVTKEAPNRFRIVLEPGMYHNIKRRCEDLGYRVQHLQRVRIAQITPSKLSVGMWRTMTDAEVERIKSVVSGRGRRETATARNEDDLYGHEFPARRSASAARSQGGRPERPLSPARPVSSRPAGGPGQKKTASAPRSSAPKGKPKAAAAGRSPKPASKASRNSVTKGRNRS